MSKAIWSVEYSFPSCPTFRPRRRLSRSSILRTGSFHRASACSSTGSFPRSMLLEADALRPELSPPLLALDEVAEAIEPCRVERRPSLCEAQCRRRIVIEEERSGRQVLGIGSDASAVGTSRRNAPLPRGPFSTLSRLPA